MDLQSPPATTSQSTDPFQLERLAEELAVRESSHPISPPSQQFTDPDDTDLPAHELPLYTPLTHHNPFFTAETFNVEDFLLSRSHTSLPDLRSELRDYLGSLKEELVKLINDDYEAFISLSTDLRGEGTRLDQLKAPLGGLKSQILESREELNSLQEAIQTKLKKRAALRDEKAFLHLLLKISESITRLESLLLITTPGEASPELKNMSLSKSLSGTEDESHDERLRGNRAKHLARVAAEYTQLLYHAKKANSEQHSAFVDEMQWRIDRVKSTISSDLDHLFSSTVISLTDTKGSKLTEVEKTKHMADMAECLRTYDVLGLWRDAEDVLRRDLVREFVKKAIYPGALSAPRSPLLPHTPLPVRGLSPAPVTASFLPPRTPYTPFTAFASKQNPFEGAINSSSAYLLDDTGNPLAGLYNAILKFVDRDLKRIMEVAEKVSIKAIGPKPSEAPSAKAESANPRYGSTFEIMANVVWAEIGRAIMDELGAVVFAAGKPDDFRKNHETTQAFIRSLQYLAPSARAVEAMTSHPVFTAFERRWQLPVYFQLRWKEIVTKVEDALATNKLEPNASKGVPPFATSQGAAVWTAIGTCWNGDVFVPQLSHRFWKLTLQLISRYRTWLESCLPRLDALPKAVATDKTPATSAPSLSRAATPNPPVDGSMTESAPGDDTSLRQFAAAITDIKALESSVTTIWSHEISMMLPTSLEDTDSDHISPEDALKHALASLTSLIPPMSNQIVAILSRRACEPLTSVRSIPSQFRAMSNKRPPTEPSYFVASILRPVQTFFAIGANDGPGVAMKAEYLKAYSEEVFENVVQRYIIYLAHMKKTEESLRRLKKPTFSLFGNSSAANDDRDEERIRTQMALDVEAFGKDAEKLGVDVKQSASFKTLNDMVRASLKEGASTT
ncbi:COG complex component [Dentipellis sp. KUC8613]|nr:COG complex component [Dentipellis sp. KUC8613]